MKRPEEIATAAWPVLVALGTVMSLWVGLMAFDIVGDLDTEARTTELVDKALRSVTLADDLRRQVHALAEASDRDAARAAIAHDMETYDPLATYADERSAWMRLQGQLGLIASGSAPVDRLVLRDLEASLDRIVEINQREAARTVAGILTSFHQDYMIDAVGGSIGIVLAFAIGAALLRSIRRHRALLDAHLALTDQRQRELEAFAGRVAHDLRGPLAPVRGYAQLLYRGGGPPPDELGRRIETATDRMTAIIDDLLTLSISGQLEPGESELAPIVAQILDDAAPQLAGAKVERALVDARVRASRTALCRIVQNLVSNAIKYRSPERPLELGVTATRHDASIELVVSDNGVGMDEATAARAFDPLFRGDATRAIPGHGLGLAIVKRTVDVLGGACRISSTPGEGTRIVVELPAA